MKIALATCAELPNLDADDQHLLKALREAEIETEVPVWDDPAVDWAQYQLVIIRSTWDYVPKRDQYVAWAERVAKVTELWNPAPLIAWNTTKAYLKELEEKGVACVPTQWFSTGSTVDFEALLAQPGWEDAVIKPVISAAGRDTYRINRETVAPLLTELQCLLQTRDLMLQPFMKTVATTGELSFIMLDGEFSHAIAKVPATGEFRIHEHLGGIYTRFEPTEAQHAFTRQVLDALPWPTLYARIDAMPDETGRMLLSELEVTEPSLYVGHAPDSAQRFVDAAQKKLSRLAVPS